MKSGWVWLRAARTRSRGVIVILALLSLVNWCRKSVRSSNVIGSSRGSSRWMTAVATKYAEPAIRNGIK